MPNSRSTIAFAAIALTFAAALAQQSPSKRPVAIEDFFAIQRVGLPRLSPDGTRFAYTVSQTDHDKDKSETALWMGFLDGREPIRMTAKGYSAGNPRWSPDGRYLSFQAARGEGRSQVWAFDLRGGDAQQLTEVKQGIQSYLWSPDGKRLLLTIRDPKPEDLMEEAERKKQKPKPWVIDRLQFKRDNVGYLDRRRTHLYVFDLADKKQRQITSGDYDDRQPAFSPDGKLVAFVSNRSEEPDGNSNSDIWVVSADNTDKGKTLLRITDNPGSDSQPAWSPDGQSIAYATVIQPEIIWYATTHLAVVSSKGGTPRLLTRQVDRNISSPRFSADGASIHFVLEDSAERHLAKISPQGGELERIVDGQRSIRGFDLGPEGAITFLSSASHQPTEGFLLRRGQIEQLTEVNRKIISQLQLAEVENIQFPSSDGSEIEGFIYKPAGFDPNFKYPALLRIHGGPVSQYDFGFRFDPHLFAANGYVVVESNPRGSSGYGQDFSLAIWQDWGNKDFQDVMAAVDYAIGQGYVDPERMGVGGWSYGGILTNYVITKTDRFKAAITGASEVLYASNYGHDHYQLQWELELGLPWDPESRKNWERISPFNSVARIVTPTLIMGGEKDWNVPILNSEQLYQALRRLGRETQLVVYPGQHHGIRLPTFIKDRYQRYLDWYGRFVKDQEPAPSTPR